MSKKKKELFHLQFPFRFYLLKGGTVQYLYCREFLRERVPSQRNRGCFLRYLSADNAADSEP